MTAQQSDIAAPVAWSGHLPGLAASPFPPIADYGFLSDCETTALVAPNGAVEWLCLPRMDSPSVFGAVLDRDAGTFRVSPDGVDVPASRRYVPGTMVLETTWCTRTGWLQVLDVLLMGPWHHEGERSGSHMRAPTDYDADHVLLRVARCLSGQVQLRMECAPMFDYGRTAAQWSYPDDAYRTAQAIGGNEGPRLLLTTDTNVGFEGAHATSRTLVKEGEWRYFALSWSEHAPPATVDEALDRLTWTEHHWRHWLDRGDFPDHRWLPYLQRSALTLKGLTFAPTGAIAAAATTSLPETPGGERNWDYRYSWIRDSALALWALYALGFDWEANDFFYFVAEAAEAAAGHLQIMYGVDGRSRLDEEVLAHLDGYEGAYPVRIGNGAYDQAQHDVWGAAVGAIYQYVRSRDRLDDRLWRIVVTQVEAALENWRGTDRGPWEVRGEPQHFTTSKIACWLAADRGARLAALRGDAKREDRWARAASEIRDDVLANAVDDRGVLCQHYATTALDASLLLMPIVGFLSPEDPRCRATVLAIADELTTDDLVLRYLVEDTDDGLSGEEGTFTICSFALVSALAVIGEVGRATALCEKLLASASSLHLYAEEIDPHSGRHLGNFPQAFTHLGLIQAVMNIVRAEKKAARR